MTKEKDKVSKKERFKWIRAKIFNKAMLINLLAFMIPIAIIVGHLVYKEILTGGKFFFRGELVNIADMGCQYTSLFTYFHNALIGKDSFFYSFSHSIGGNMASTIGYYLSSPFNILYGIVSTKDISLITYISYVIKIALCSLFMNIFLTHKFGVKKTNLLFASIYAFMGFVVIYYFNTMWLDVIYMTPLVIMGLEKLIKGKPLMYIITLSLSLIFNFYMAYMLCIFCVIYFLYELFIQYEIKDIKKYYKHIIRFAVSSLAAAGLAAFFLLPVALNMLNIMRTPLPKDQLRFYFENFFTDFIDTVFSKSYIGSHNYETILGRNRPALYICFFSLALSALYFFNKKIKKREKVLSFIVIFFFIISFMIPHLQLFWQGFTFPNGYIDRFSFLYSFFLILLSAKQFYTGGKIKIWQILTVFVVFVAISFAVKGIGLVYLYNRILIISAVFLLAYLVLYYFMLKQKKKKDIKWIKILISIIVISEITYNYYLTYLSSDHSGLSNYYSEKANFLAKLENVSSEAYRLDGDYNTMVDNFATLNNGVNMAVTTNNRGTYEFLYRYGQGLSYTTVFYDYNRAPVFDSIMSVKYLLASTTEPLFYKQHKEDGYIVPMIYENPYALNIGYMIDDNYSSRFDGNSASGFDNLNSLVKAISGIDEDVFEKIPFKKLDNLKYQYDIDRKDKYLFLTTDYELEVNFGLGGSVFLNGEHDGTIQTSSLGDYAIKNKYKGKKLTLEVKDTENVKDVYLYYFNEDVLKKATDILKKHQLKNTYMKGNTVKGNINIDKDGTLLLTVIYDKGWKAYVDGKKVKAKNVVGGLTGIDLKKGNHTITMKYYPPGMSAGIIISLISLSGIIIYVLKSKKVENKSSVKKTQNKNKKIDKKNKI